MKTKPCCAKTPELWWDRYFKTRRLSYRNRLIEHYLDLAEKQVWRAMAKIPFLNIDDVRGAAYEGLIEAVEKYDRSRKAKFETFCRYRIFGAIIDWLRKTDHQSRTLREFEKNKAKKIDLLRGEYKREPTEDEIIEGMGLTREHYCFNKEWSVRGQVVSFNAIGLDNNEDQYDVPGNFDAPYQKIDEEMTKEFLTRGMTKNERLTMVLYYYEELTMGEIGAVLNLSESRVSQIHKTCLHSLRQRLGHIEKTRVI